MISAAISRLHFLCEKIPGRLREVDNVSLEEKRSPDQWSKKEIIGHLIDSATNNHQRFIRVLFEDTPAIHYDQNRWNRFNYYQEIDGLQLIEFWTSYNRHLLEIIKRIPAEHLNRRCQIGENSFPLHFIINDYVHHMEHHLKQVVSY